MIAAGSPGDRFRMKNTMNVTPIITGISISSLFNTYLYIFLSPILVYLLH